MTFKPEQIAALSAPLHKAHVKERAQAGRNLSYIEAWHAIAEANRIFGFDAWNRETVELIQLGEGRQVNGKWRVGYRARVRITVGTIVREGCGFGSGIDNDLDQAHESALKEAESDAMKRALMTFGNPFGLALYDKTQANVTTARPEASEPSSGRKSSAQAKRDGDDAKIKADIAKADHAGLRDWAENFDSYTAHLPASWLDSIRDMMEHRLEELAGEDRVASEAAELDDAFRGTVHRGSAAGVAGNGRDVAHAG
jgi:DNA repair and recombination protein RAD52